MIPRKKLASFGDPEPEEEEEVKPSIKQVLGPPACLAAALAPLALLT